MRNLITIVFTICAVNSALAQKMPGDSARPFGISMGTPKARLGPVTKEVNSFFYQLAGVPKPHRAFELYYAQATPTYGTCFIKAVGITVPTSSFGTQLQTAFSTIKEQLESVYGTAEVTDELNRGSIWNEPRDWMLGLKQKDRELTAHWSGGDLRSLHPGLQEIYLVAKALDSDRGYLVLEYYFENYEKCEAESQKSESKVF